MSGTKRAWWYHALYLSLPRATPLALVLLSSCMKATEKKEDLGPAYSEQQINDAIIKAASKGAHLRPVSSSTFLSFANTRRIENSETMINLGQRLVKVKDMDSTGSHITLEITEKQRRNDGTFSPDIVSEDYFDIPASTASAGTAVMGTLKPLALDFTATYHHLRESDGTRDAPPAVRGRSNCAGLNPCTIPVHYVQFDIVAWSKDQSTYQKFSRDFAFTEALPYLPFGSNLTRLTGSPILDCISTFVPIDGRTVYVRDCMDLDDFQK